MCRIITETVSSECNNSVHICIIFSYIKLNISIRLIIRNIFKLISIYFYICIADQILRLC